MIKKTCKRILDYSDSSEDEIWKPTKKIHTNINIAGNFPCFFFIEVSNNKIIDNLFKKMDELSGGIEKIRDLHISLSQTFALNLHQIDGFLNKVKSNFKSIIHFIPIIIENLAYFKKIQLKILAFEIDSFSSSKLAQQSFIVLKISKNEEIIDIIKEIDIIMKAYKFPTLFFEDYTPHISIAYSELNQEKIKESIVSLKKLDISKEFFDLNVERVVLKVGERLNYLNLR